MMARTVDNLISLKGLNNRAQGNALGSNAIMNSSPEGAEQEKLGHCLCQLCSESALTVSYSSVQITENRPIFM